MPNIALWSGEANQGREQGHIEKTPTKEDIMNKYIRNPAKTLPSVVLWLAVLPLAALGQGNYATPYTFTTIAGSHGVSGGADGTNRAAQFDLPVGLRLDSAGNLYLAEQNNHTVRKITPVGTNWVVTTLAGLAGVSGFADGTNSFARFHDPDCAAVDSASNLYVADALNYAIRKVTPVGTNWVVTTLAGKVGHAGEVDGTNEAALFDVPVSTALDDAGNIFVPDAVGNTIRKLSLVGTNCVVTTLAGKAGVVGSRDGTNGAALFNSPYDLAVDSAGNVYVADFGNCLIRKITPVGTNWVVTTLAGLGGQVGYRDGTGSEARFTGPSGIAVDGGGNLYLSDSGTTPSSTIRKLTPVGTNWVVTTLAGRDFIAGFADGTGSAARFDNPESVVVDSSGNLFVADGSNNTIRKGYPELIIANWTSFAPSLSFSIIGPGGQTVVVDASTDLVSWLPIWTNTLTFPAPVRFTDPATSANSSRFYRAQNP
jgi:hypothetical protein